VITARENRRRDVRGGYFSVAVCEGDAENIG
jgi:hypothetical protein